MKFSCAFLFACYNKRVNKNTNPNPQEENTMKKLIPILMILCLLPGFAIAAVFRGLMRLTGAPTVTETVRVCLGKGGASAFFFPVCP